MGFCIYIGSFIGYGGSERQACQAVTGKYPVIGIAKTDIDKLFKSFSQVDGSITRNFGGTGLGLNISKILSERHGGNIQIANNKAGGACVTVKINCNES